jgi:NTP pyrophosphatase (non-canonical NTP hydrolase)
MDASTSVESLKLQIAKFAHDREWEQFHAPKNLSMAIAAEAAELMEHFLWASGQESLALCENKAKRTKIEEELADVVILALQFANITKIDIASAVSAKIARNAAKYPVSKAKGRSEKYTDL